MAVLYSEEHQVLPWATRIKVALDVARGLSYLHEREIPVIHRAFRTASILLDEVYMCCSYFLANCYIDTVIRQEQRSINNYKSYLINSSSLQSDSKC